MSYDHGTHKFGVGLFFLYIFIEYPRACTGHTG